MIIPHKENFIIKTRNFLWNYPDKLFSRGGFFYSVYEFYKMVRPFSHIFIFSVIFILLGVFISSTDFQIVQGQTHTLVEGVITGAGGLSRINPLLPTNKQLENDLASLLYLPLMRVNSSGEVKTVLAYSWEQLDEEGLEYKFYLRDDVYWHDGERFTADDVVATFEVLKALGGEDQGVIVSKNAELAQEVELTKIDNYTIVFKLNEILPTFFEDVTFGILPKHVLDEISLSTFSWAKFNLQPNGTGPFIFKSLKDNRITLVANDKYFLKKPKISKIEIIMFEDGDKAVEALKFGNIHILTDPSTAIVSDLNNWSNVNKVQSANLYRRYLGLYFNLKEGGPLVFQDKNIRQAISLAINRETIIEKVANAGVEAMGPISKNSWAYNENATRYLYDVKKAAELLDEAGWEQKEIGGRIVRMKDDEILRFEISYLDKYDRNIVADIIQSDLEKLGIIVNIDPRTSSDLNEALIATRNFEAVLYGVETSIDPDRIRLWHSKAINYPGLNISSYISNKTAAVIGDSGEIERVSLLDASLENGLSSLDRERRNGSGGLSIGYLKFQEILLEDCPVVFLYHPLFTYAAHSRVKGIDLSDMTAPEDRYLSVTEWYIE